MFKIIIWGFILYLLYKFIFELVVPVSKATSQVKDKMREMQEAQQRQMQEQASQREQQQATASRSTPSTTGGDYIDFEEVK